MNAPIWIRVWTIWAVSLAVHLLFFLVVEGAALFHRQIGDTLSETVWYLRDTGSWLYLLILDICTVMAVTMAWVIFHFKWQTGRVV